MCVRVYHYTRIITRVSFHIQNVTRACVRAERPYPYIRAISLKLTLLGAHGAPHRGAAGRGAASVPVEPGEAEGSAPGGTAPGAPRGRGGGRRLQQQPPRREQQQEPGPGARAACPRRRPSRSPAARVYSGCTSALSRGCRSLFSRGEPWFPRGSSEWEGERKERSGTNPQE